MLIQTQEMVPHEQPMVIKRLRTIKAPPKRPVSLRVDDEGLKKAAENFKLSKADMHKLEKAAGLSCDCDKVEELEDDAKIDADIEKLKEFSAQMKEYLASV